MTTFTGTSGDDTIIGSPDSDIFHLEQGGEDTVAGKGGYEQFYMGGAFDGGDRIDGGGGKDTVWLDGDDSTGMTFAATTMKNVETLRFVAGHDYVIAGFSDANLTPHFKANGRFLAAGDSLHFDASETTIGLEIDGGGGADLLVGGAGNDVLDGGEGRNTLIGGDGADGFFLRGSAEHASGGEGDDGFEITTIDARTERDKIDGGAGTDFLKLSGSGVLVMRDHTIQNIERIYVTSHLDLTMADANVAAGKVVAIDANFAFDFRFDGSQESDATFEVSGSDFYSSTLIGGAGNDSLYGGSEADVLIGGAGRDVLFSGSNNTIVDGHGDTITGGLGADVIHGARTTASNHFVYQSAEDSTVSAAGRIVQLNDKKDVIDLSAIDADTGLAGDQAFHLVSAFTGQAGELVVAYDVGSGFTTVSGDVNGDGVADLQIELKGDHSDFTSFAL